MSWIENKESGRTAVANHPFLLHPAAKDYLWGGTRLKDDFGFNIDINPFAEAWVCSTHPDGESITADGMRLSEVLKAHPEHLLCHPATAGDENLLEFPFASPRLS